MYATFRKCQGSGVYIIYALQQVEHSIDMLYGVFPRFSVSQKRTQAAIRPSVYRCRKMKKKKKRQSEGSWLLLLFFTVLLLLFSHFAITITTSTTRLWCKVVTVFWLNQKSYSNIPQSEYDLNRVLHVFTCQLVQDRIIENISNNTGIWGACKRGRGAPAVDAERPMWWLQTEQWQHHKQNSFNAFKQQSDSRNFLPSRQMHSALLS